MHAGAAVHLGRILSRHHRHPHVYDGSVRRSRAAGLCRTPIRYSPITLTDSRAGSKVRMPGHRENLQIGLNHEGVATRPRHRVGRREGKRLYPLTADRAKPAVPFGGAYRLIDFVLSNLVNARYLRICVLTQYKSHSLDRHISQNWRLSGLAGEYITPVPAQQRLGPRWYIGLGRRDLSVAEPDLRRGPRLHRRVRRRPSCTGWIPSRWCSSTSSSGAGASVAGIRVPRAEASAFGCIDADESGRILEFVEKPADPPGTPGRSRADVLASMGNYIFTARCSIDAIRADADDDHSDHDMGGDIIPRLASDGMAAVYDFSQQRGARRHRTRSRLLARRRVRSTRSTTRTWTWCRCSRCSTSTTSAGRSAAIR